MGGSGGRSGRCGASLIARAVIEVLEARRLLAAYSIVDLGSLRTVPVDDGEYIPDSALTVPTAINNSGHVVGASQLNPYDYTYAYKHAFLFADGHIKDLGTLGGASSSAVDVNNSDQVIGQADTAERDPAETFAPSKPFLYTDGKMRPLQEFLPANTLWTVTSALRINDQGLILAEAEYDHAHAPPPPDGSGGDNGGDDGGDDGNVDEQTLADDGADAGGGGGAEDTGDGGSDDDGGDYVPPPGDLDLTAPPTAGEGYLVLIDLAHGGAVTRIAGIRTILDWGQGAELNDAGQVAAVFAEPDFAYSYHTFLYTNGAWADVTEDDNAYHALGGLNDHGDVVNYVWEGAAGFLYHAGHAAQIALPRPDWRIETDGINNGGDFVGLLSGSVGAPTDGFYEPIVSHDGQIRFLNNLIPGSAAPLGGTAGINDAGQIIAVGEYSSESFVHAYLLTPNVSSGGPGARDDVRPTVEFVAGSTLTTVGADPTFTVRFHDDRGVDPGSITGDDFSARYVAGDNYSGKVGKITLVSETVDPDGKTVTATFTAARRGPVWNHHADATYAVRFGRFEDDYGINHPRPVGVADTAGNHPIPFPLGTFEVALPDTSRAFDHAAESAMTLDAAGNLHYVYYDADARAVMYAVRDPDFHWGDPVVVDGSGDAAEMLSLALDSNGHPGVAWWDASHADLKYAHFDGANWTAQTLEARRATGGYPSLAYDAAGNPAIAYWRKASHDLRLARFDGAAWSSVVLDDSSTNTGRYPSLKLDPATHRLALAWQDYGGKSFKYAAERPDGTFDTTVVATTDDGGGWVSLAFNPKTNLPAFAYYDSGVVADRLAWYDGSQWNVNDLPAVASRRGYYNRLDIDPDGRATVLFYRPKTGNLFSASTTIGDEFNEPEFVAASGPKFSGVFSTRFGLTVAAFDVNTGAAKVDDLPPPP